MNNKNDYILAIEEEHHPLIVESECEKLTPIVNDFM